MSPEAAVTLAWGIGAATAVGGVFLFERTLAWVRHRRRLRTVGMAADDDWLPARVLEEARTQMNEGRMSAARGKQGERTERRNMANEAKDGM